ncbi:MAG: hypothetical protein H0W73_09955 [Bacteroidetes bacterium]|nr:hypothetical protein [Bacteroidota bacterium]
MKKLLIYLIVFVVIVFTANYCYVKLGLYNADIIKCNAEVVFKLDSSLNDHNILYLGESSNFTYSDKDSSKKSISELIDESNPDHKILTISKGAIHAGNYKLLIKRIKKTSSIKTIILTVNLRSFGINWIESDLETNLSRSNILYTNYPPIVKKLLLSFKAYDNQEIFKRKENIRSHYKKDKFKLTNLKYETVRDWDADMFNKGVLDETGNKNEEKTNIACHFIKNYAFVIDEDNPRIKDLDEIVSYCKTNNLNLIFNLLPENYERANELCQKDLEVLMQSNVNFLKKRYEHKTIFVNNFALLKDSCFIDRSWPTEHYIYFGRKAVAENVNVHLSKIQKTN